jgi:phage shock protein PspC (stress-responsive transcriptional regulator)
MNRSVFETADANDDSQDVLMLRRSGSMFTGVCSGIAHYVGVDPTVIRFSAVTLSLVSACVVPLYITLAFVLPHDCSKPVDVAKPWFDGFTLVQQLKSGFRDMLKAATRRDKAAFHCAWRLQIDGCCRAWTEAVNR